jgi:hypothetical protein
MPELSRLVQLRFFLLLFPCLIDVFSSHLGKDIAKHIGDSGAGQSPFLLPRFGPVKIRISRQFLIGDIPIGVKTGKNLGKNDRSQSPHSCMASAGCIYSAILRILVGTGGGRLQVVFWFPMPVLKAFGKPAAKKTDGQNDKEHQGS